MKPSNDSLRMHDQKSERSLCASTPERNCTLGQYTASERRIWWPRNIVGTANILIARDDPGTSHARACAFGLARKAPK
jgi:hypothetical protein